MAKRFLNLEDAMNYVQTLPIQTLMEEYAKTLCENFEPIKVTEQQFKTMFKIIGVTTTGETERRGRPKKEKIGDK